MLGYLIWALNDPGSLSDRKIKCDWILDKYAFSALGGMRPLHLMSPVILNNSMRISAPLIICVIP